MTPHLDKLAVRRGFNNAAASYDSHSVVAASCLERLLERLDYIKCDPSLVADIGAGTGAASRALQKRFPGAHVVAVDFAPGMLSRMPRSRWRRRASRIVGEAEQLPLRSDSADLMVSASVYAWCNDLHRLFAEAQRVLKPGGVLLFATYGPDTLRELREAWLAVDREPHVHEFADMHDLGDAMLRCGLADPVVDAEWLTVDYASPLGLFADLRATGAVNAAMSRRRGLRASSARQRLLDAYPNRGDGRCEATVELVYGHAWGSAARPNASLVQFELARDQ